MPQIFHPAPSVRTAVAQAALLLLCSTASQAQQPAAIDQSTVTLAPITVRAGTDQHHPTAPIRGFVAQRALTAPKTDTPLLETPQAISVITRDQM